MKRIILIFTVLLFFYKNYATAQNIFQKTYGDFLEDYGSCIRQTADSGYIIAGRTNGTVPGFPEVYLLKTNENGDILWTKTFGGSELEKAEEVQQTSDGGYIILGWTGSFGAGSLDILLVKTDAAGDTLWTKAIGGTDHDYANSIKQTLDGGFILVGSSLSAGLGNYDVCLVKTNSTGDIQWSKFMGSMVNNDDGYSVEQTADSGYVITGGTYSFGAGVTDVYLIKTDVDGTLQWSKTFGGNGLDYGECVHQTNDGGYIISGRTNSFGAGSYDVYLLKTDANGNLTWNRTFGDTGEDYGYEVIQNTNDEFMVTGITRDSLNNSDVYLVKTNSNGDSLWTRTYGGPSSDAGYSLQQTIDGGYIIAGSAYGLGTGYSDVYLIKTDSMGISGCNEGIKPNMVTDPPTQIFTPATVAATTSFQAMGAAPAVSSSGIVTTICSPAAINEVKMAFSFLISPNPSTGNFTISFESLINHGDIEILNTLGKKVYSSSFSNELKKKIELKDVASGMYIVKIHDGKQHYCNKLMIESN